MDIKATMQFILESQARSEIRLDKALARADRADAYMEGWEARANRADARMEKQEASVKAMNKRLDKGMGAITKLVQQGIRMLVGVQTAQKELAAEHKETQRELRAFIKSLSNGSNGCNGH